MFSPNTIKFFFSLVCAAFFCGCGWRQTANENAATPAPFVAEELKSAAPFQTKEPENYQADLIIITGAAESKIFTARRGANYRVDYESGENRQTSVVQKGDGKSFLILRGEKIYAETTSGETSAAPVSNNPADTSGGEWLNIRADARFANLGSENGLTKYRVNLDESLDAETIVFVDENLNLPVRQEFYSLRDGERTRTYAVEMRNFRLQTDAGLFEIPANYKRVSLETLRAAVRAGDF